MEIPTNYTRRNLPHFQPGDSYVFVTSRLKHTISKVEGLRLKQNAPGKTAAESDHAKHFQEIDFMLDAARHDPKYLSQPNVRDLLHERFDFVAQWIDFVAYTSMPNHFHFVGRLTGDKSLPDIMKLFKGNTAKRINELLGKSGPLWQSESYDRVVREGRLGNVVRYILNNPVKARLVKEWQDWPGTFLSENFLGLETLGLKPFDRLKPVLHRSEDRWPGCN